MRIIANWYYETFVRLSSGENAGDEPSTRKPLPVFPVSPCLVCATHGSDSQCQENPVEGLEAQEPVAQELAATLLEAVDANTDNTFSVLSEPH
jgi:hypothetical protein